MPVVEESDGLSGTEIFMSNEPISIVIAKTHQDLASAYRMRLGEVGTPQHNISSANDEYRDKCDIAGVPTLVAKAGHQVVGTVRLVPRSICADVFDDICRWDILSQRYGLTIEEIQAMTGIIGRGVVLGDWRGKGIMSLLMQEVENIARQENIRFIQGYTREGYIDAWPLLEKYGYQIYAVMKENHELPGFSFWIKDLHVS